MSPLHTTKFGARNIITEESKNAVRTYQTEIAHHETGRDADRLDGVVANNPRMNDLSFDERLSKRFARFGLKLHPDKTRLLDFRAPSRSGRYRSDSFEFLGFTHHWGRTKRGTWVVRRKTASSRFSRGLRRIWEWCRLNRHLSLDEQTRILGLKLKGHYGYYGITGNFRALKRFLNEVQNTWRYWLNRRSHSAPMTWRRFLLILDRRPLPRPRIVQSVYRRAANP